MRTSGQQPAASVAQCAPPGARSDPPPARYAARADQPDEMDRSQLWPMADEQLPPPSHLVVAEVLAPWGLQGELKARILTDFPERFQHGLALFVGEKKVPYVLERARPQRGFLILKLKGCDTPEAADKLRGAFVYVARQDAPELLEGEYFWYQIIGLRAVTPAGEELGVVEDIIITGSNDVYVLQGERGEILVPALEDVVQQVDLKAGLMVVELPEGLL